MSSFWRSIVTSRGGVLWSYSSGEPSLCYRARVISEFPGNRSSQEIISNSRTFLFAFASASRVITKDYSLHFSFHITEIFFSAESMIDFQRPAFNPSFRRPVALPWLESCQQLFLWYCLLWGRNLVIPG